MEISKEAELSITGIDQFEIRREGNLKQKLRHAARQIGITLYEPLDENQTHPNNLTETTKRAPIFLSTDRLWGCQHLKEDVTFPKIKEGKKVKDSGHPGIST